MSREILTDAEQTLSDYIIAHYADVPSMTVRGLAQASFVSSTTVLRLCGKLGFDSFTAFKVQLSRESSDEFARMARINYDVPFGPDAEEEEIIKRISEIAISSIINTRDHFDYAAARKICGLLKAKKIIDVYGMGNSLSSAQEFCEKMGHIGYVITSIDKSDQGMTRALASGPNQVAILVSCSGLNRGTLQLVKPLRQRGTKMIAITGNPDSPLLHYADHYLLVDAHEDLLQSRKTDHFGALYSLHCLFDFLYAMLYASDYEERERHARLVSRFQPVNTASAGDGKGRRPDK